MKAETVRGVRYCLAVFVGVRLAIFVLGAVAVGLVPPIDPVSVPGWPAHPTPDPGWHNLFTVWERFDALWFLRIAADGYHTGDGSAAFFPLYPLVTRVVSFLLGGHPYAAAMLVSNAAFAGALCVLYTFTASEVSVPVARRTVLLVALFPTSFFFFSPYSESLFLLLAVTAFWAARRERWATAALAGALAALTRNVGVVIAPALLVEALHQRAEREGPVVPGIAAAVAAGLGTLSYLAFWALKSGDWLEPLTSQSQWQRVATWPTTTVTEATKTMVRLLGGRDGGYWAIDWLLVVPVLVAAVLVLFRHRPSYGLYVWASLLIPLTFVFQSRPFMSMPRLVLPLFPAFWVIAERLERWRVPQAAIVGVSAGGLALLTALYVNWYYIF